MYTKANASLQTPLVPISMYLLCIPKSTLVSCPYSPFPLLLHCASSQAIPDYSSLPAPLLWQGSPTHGGLVILSLTISAPILAFSSGSPGHVQSTFYFVFSLLWTLQDASKCSPFLTYNIKTLPLKSWSHRLCGLFTVTSLTVSVSKTSYSL